MILWNYIEQKQNSIQFKQKKTAKVLALSWKMLIGKDVLPEKDVWEKVATIKRFE